MFACSWDCSCSLLFQTDRPTVIEYDDHEYLFEGFSLFSHTPLTNVSLLWIVSSSGGKPWIFHHSTLRFLTVTVGVSVKSFFSVMLLCFIVSIFIYLLVRSRQFLLRWAFRRRVSHWVYSILFVSVMLSIAKVKYKCTGLFTTSSLTFHLGGVFFCTNAWYSVLFIDMCSFTNDLKAKRLSGRNRIHKPKC